ncbi:MAG: BtpA/SgcQ family protein [Krumholzibacteria bacterium]|nr:BtpA/SgcQ family protein [Candidatus Krumholzibacteria bacterium]
MWNRNDFLAAVPLGTVGMIHLQPLPGSPRWGGDLAAVRAAALRDADALVEAGWGAVMVENYHDVPFFPEAVPAHTVAALTALVGAVRERHPGLVVGVNVLRNDAAAALGVAAATGARFVRVNVHAGAAVTDQGPLAGRAWHTLRLRRELGLEDVGILADVRVKHARPLVERSLAEEAADLRLRGLADALIVTGPATGAPVALDDLRAVRAALPDCPLLAGSGATADTVAELLRHADGCIVGSSLQRPEPATGRPAPDPGRAHAFLAAVAAARRKD